MLSLENKIRWTVSSHLLFVTILRGFFLCTYPHIFFFLLLVLLYEQINMKKLCVWPFYHLHCFHVHCSFIILYFAQSMANARSLFLCSFRSGPWVQILGAAIFVQDAPGKKAKITWCVLWFRETKENHLLMTATAAIHFLLLTSPLGPVIWYPALNVSFWSCEHYVPI